MKKAALAGLVVIVAIGAIAVYLNRQDDPLPHAPDDVVALWLDPFPEGPVSPKFTAEPGNSDLPLDTVADAIPSPLPRDVWQGLNCDMGGDVVVKVRGGDEIRYGPCRRPADIEQLHREMLQALKS